MPDARLLTSRTRASYGVGSFVSVVGHLLMNFDVNAEGVNVLPLELVRNEKQIRLSS